MTDRVHSLTVVLESDARTDDLEPLVKAIQQLRGVLTVKQHVANFETFMAQERVRRELGEKLMAVLYPKSDGGRNA